MSSIDQAFIKAYAKGPRSEAASGESEAPPRAGAAPKAPPVIETWAVPNSDRYHRLEAGHGLAAPKPPLAPHEPRTDGTFWQHADSNRPLPYPDEGTSRGRVRIDGEPSAESPPAARRFAAESAGDERPARAAAPSAEPHSAAERFEAPAEAGVDPWWTGLYSFDTTTTIPDQPGPRSSAPSVAPGTPEPEVRDAAVRDRAPQHRPATHPQVEDAPTPPHDAAPHAEPMERQEPLAQREAVPRQEPAAQPKADERTPAAPAEASAGASAEPFNPVWEVDVFGMPEVVERLDQHSAGVLATAGEQLAGAVREGLRVLAVTSPGRGQGRTTVAIQVAQAVAACGLRVALVDGDLDNPALADRLCLDIARGWFDALRDGLPLDEVAVQSVEDGITLLPLLRHAGGPRPTPADPVVDRMLDRLTGEFDLVVIDSGHVNAVGGALLGAGSRVRIDAALLVCDTRHAGAEERGSAAERLRRLGIDHIGVVENFCGG